MSDEPIKIILGDTAIAAAEITPTRRWFGRPKDRQIPPFSQCENCGAELLGHWCSQCGQPAVDYRRSFRHVVGDVLESFLNWDSKFFATLGLLIAKPWCLTNDFLAGKRIRYVNPLRLYLLVSILFFFAATYGIKSARLSPINLSPAQRAAIRDAVEHNKNVTPDVRSKINEALGGVSLAPEKRSKLEAELKREDLPTEVRQRIEERLNYGDLPPDARAKMQEAFKGLPDNVRAEVEKALKESREDAVVFQADNERPSSLGRWLEGRIREKFGEHGINLQLLLVTLMNNLPYMMFCCVPLFALVLKILYLRRRFFYIDHLIHALHIHAFAYLGVMMIVLATIGIHRANLQTIGELIITALWIAFGAQIFLSIRKVYRQGWFLTVFKFLVGGFVYLMVLTAALAATFLVTLAS